MAPTSKLKRMWPFRGRHKKPVLKPEPDPGRQELLESQLKNTLDYGWHGSGKQDAKEFFDSLGPADEVSRISDRIPDPDRVPERQAD